MSHFAADVDPVEAKVRFSVQQPLAASTLGDVMGVPAWKSLPSWYMVAAEDEAIPPDAERQFAKRMGATSVEVASAMWRWFRIQMRWLRSRGRLPKPFRFAPR